MELMRYTSLDMARGFAIVLMLFFNAFSIFSYEPPTYLQHGVNNMMPADLIAPLFEFILGAALVISVNRRKERGENIWKHVLKRAILLILLGMLLTYGASGLKELNWGVLQALGTGLVIAYLFVSLPVAWRAVSAFLILAVYALLLAYVPWIHHAVENGVHGGIIGSVSYSVIAIFGTVFGTWFYDKKEKLEMGFAAGALLIAISAILNFYVPFNSDTVSTSFVMFSSGFAFLVSCGFYFMGETRKREIKLLSMFGRNALLLWISQYFVLYYPLVLLGMCCFFPSFTAIGPAVMMLFFYYVLADVLDWKKIRMPFYS